MTSRHLMVLRKSLPWRWSSLRDGNEQEERESKLVLSLDRATPERLILSCQMTEPSSAEVEAVELPVLPTAQIAVQGLCPANLTINIDPENSATWWGLRH